MRNSSAAAGLAAARPQNGAGQLFLAETAAFRDILERSPLAGFERGRDLDAAPAKIKRSAESCQGQARSFQSNKCRAPCPTPGAAALSAPRAKDAPVGRDVAQNDPLGRRPGKDHVMLADRCRRPGSRQSPMSPRRRSPVMPRRGPESETSARSTPRPRATASPSIKGGARRRIDLVAVVAFHDLHVEIGIERIGPACWRPAGSAGSPRGSCCRARQRSPRGGPPRRAPAECPASPRPVVPITCTQRALRGSAAHGPASPRAW